MLTATPASSSRLVRKFLVELCGRAVPAIRTPEGVRALSKDQPVEPDSVTRYLETKLGDHLPAVRDALKTLAWSFEMGELIKRAFPLYEAFRPSIPAGKTGWGAKGDLDLERIKELIPNKRHRHRAK
jgi:hypothetical protein